MRRLLFFLIIFPFTLYGETTMENFKNTPETDGNFLISGYGWKIIWKIKFVSENNIKFARMTGNVTTENNGGFIQFRAQLSYKLKMNQWNKTYCQRKQSRLFCSYKDKALFYHGNIMGKNFSN